jgi:membrane dipeptidase
VAGYDLTRRHGQGLFGARFYSQVDFPRMLESGLTGAVWSIATNPFRRRSRRTRTCLKNIRRLRDIIEAQGQHLAVVNDHAGYLRARAEGKLACWLALQGGNALDSGPGDLSLIPDRLISRITLIHLLRSSLGSTSSPVPGGGGGITNLGRDYVGQLNNLRILLDLSHISERGFWEALEVHDASQPAIVSHTGTRGAHDIWRNIDDRQIKAIADLGGVIGVVFHGLYLEGSWLGGRAAAIVDHMQHIIDVAGEDVVAVGSDWDGFIITPRDMPTVLEIPRLAQLMLDRGWGAERIQKIFGANYLRVVRAIRP